jgi:hypothetical protein
MSHGNTQLVKVRDNISRGIELIDGRALAIVDLKVADIRTLGTQSEGEI